MRFSLIAASALLAWVVLTGEIASAHPRIGLSVSDDASKDASVAWRLLVSRDDFSRDTQCRLRSANGRMVYRPHALGFRFGRDQDLLGTWVRIDEGDPVRWRDMFPELARARVMMTSRDMRSPTDGIVWIPASLLTGAASVKIQTERGKQPHIFLLGNFQQVLESARAEGCTPEERFIP